VRPGGRPGEVGPDEGREAEDLAIDGGCVATAERTLSFLRQTFVPPFAPPEAPSPSTRAHFHPFPGTEEESMTSDARGRLPRPSVPALRPGARPPLSYRPTAPAGARPPLSRLPTAPAIAGLVCLPAFLLGCGQRASEDAPDAHLPAVEVAEASPAEAFLDNLAAHCGSAFRGGLTLEPPGDDMLTGTEALIVHFRECGPDTVRIPFHIEIEETGSWDRSRTWILSLAPGERLELRHDHREPDGTPSERTMYGGFTETPGTPERQDFVSVQRTEESGYARGWRIEIVPGERYTYGTTRRGEWSWRVDFDLTEPVDPPPPPWGHG